MVCISATGQSKAEFKELRNELESRVKNKELPSISVGVTRGGKLLWKESFGFADLEKGIAATSDTIYALGSLSKSITGTAVFKLVETRKIDLDRPISDYLRSMHIEYKVGDPKGYKVFHLLNMGAGIPHSYRYCYVDSGDLRRCGRDAALVSALTAFGPGEIHLYSNTSFGLAAEMIGDVVGKPFGQYMRDEIFRPASMASTFTHLDEIPRPNSKLAKPYRRDGSLAAELQFEPAGGGGFFSSVNDLLKYADIHLGRSKILQKATIDENHRVRPVLPVDYYANGWGVLQVPEHGRTLISNGAIEGAASTLLVLPDADMSVVVLVNKSVGNEVTDDIAFRIAGAVLPGYKHEIDKIFEKAEEIFAPKEFAGNVSLDGKWTGRMELNGRKLDLALVFDGKTVTASFAGKPAQTPRVLVGHGIIRSRLEIDSGTDPFGPMSSSVELIFRLRGEHLEGSAQFEARDDRPQFLRPVFFRLKRVK